MMSLEIEVQPQPLHRFEKNRIENKIAAIS